MVVMVVDEQGRTDDQVPREGDDQLWAIHIGGYGSFLFRGNEDDCEVLRRGKAEWEGGSGSKWRIDHLVDALDGKMTKETLSRLKRSFRVLRNEQDDHAMAKVQDALERSPSRWRAQDHDIVRRVLVQCIAEARANPRIANWTNYGRA